MIGYPDNLAYSSHHSNYFDNSNNNDTTSLQPVIAALYVRQKDICE